MDLQGNYTIVDGSEYGLKEALLLRACVKVSMPFRDLSKLRCRSHDRVS